MEITQTLSETEAGQCNPVVLAFLGDAVYSLWVRRELVLSGEGKASEFQRAAAKLVSAKGQSEFLNTVLPLFSAREEEIYRRGRNAKKATKAKHASAGEYSRSTGFEAVLGYLYLTGNLARIEKLLSYTKKEDLKGQAAAAAYKP